MHFKSTTETLPAYSLHNIGPKTQYYFISVHSQVQQKKLHWILWRTHTKLFGREQSFKTHHSCLYSTLRSQQSYRANKIILLKS